MVRRPAAAAAAVTARSLPELALGLHLDLGEWMYADGGWLQTDFVVDTDDPAAVGAEVDRQMAAFLRLMGRPPTHIDGHQHVHAHEPVASCVAAVAAAVGACVRHRDAHHLGGFYGQTGEGEPHPEWILPGALVTILESMPPGLSELGCHPGLGVPPAISAYSVERAGEVATLCDPMVRAAIRDLGIDLVPWAS
jgi:predicted glycoside hydrolase/deacetylase ChbG (UPF0249 family)